MSVGQEHPGARPDRASVPRMGDWTLEPSQLSIKRVRSPYIGIYRTGFMEFIIIAIDDLASEYIFRSF